MQYPTGMFELYQTHLCSSYPHTNEQPVLLWTSEIGLSSLYHPGHTELFLYILHTSETQMICGSENRALSPGGKEGLIRLDGTGWIKDKWPLILR